VAVQLFGGHLNLLAYISDKDLFAEFYRKRLARRLLQVWLRDVLRLLFVVPAAVPSLPRADSQPTTGICAALQVCCWLGI
jgi:hypothetical protein